MGKTCRPGKDSNWASRDVVSRAIMTEIEEGRGLRDERSGYDYVQLDLTKIGARRKIRTRRGSRDPVGILRCKVQRTHRPHRGNPLPGGGRSATT